MNLEELTKGHCYSQGQLQYNQPISLTDIPRIKEKNEKSKHTIQAYCLVEASNCPFYSLMSNNSYCIVSDQWLNK